MRGSDHREKGRGRSCCCGSGWKRKSFKGQRKEVIHFWFSIARAWTKQQSGSSPVSEIPARSTRPRGTTSDLWSSTSWQRSLDRLGKNRQNGTHSQRNVELCFWSNL